MAGQRLSNLRIAAEYQFNSETPSMEHKDLLALVAQVIANWSMAQTHLGNAFADLVGSRSSATVAMYASFDSFQVQRQMLVTAATELLPKRSSDIFRATLAVIERAAKERHRFAHWILGALDGHTDILLLADPKHVWRVRVAANQHFRRVKEEVIAKATKPRLDRQEIWAYREADLKRLVSQTQAAAYHAWVLSILGAVKPNLRPAVQRKLLSESQIRLAFDAERKRQSKSKKAPPRPPRLSKRARRDAALARRKQGGS